MKLNREMLHKELEILINALEDQEDDFGVLELMLVSSGMTVKVEDAQIIETVYTNEYISAATFTSYGEQEQDDRFTRFSLWVDGKELPKERYYINDDGSEGDSF